MRGYVGTWRKALMSAVVMSLMATIGWSQTLTWLHTTSGATSVAMGVSNDGRIVVGIHGNRAALWQLPANTLQTYHISGGYLAGIDALGNRAIGVTNGNDYWSGRALTWTPANGFQTLPPSNAYAWVWQITPDGRYAVGRAVVVMGNNGRIARWDFTGSTPTHRTYTIPEVGDNGCEGYGITDDGRILATYGNTSSGGRGIILRLLPNGDLSNYTILQPAPGYIYSEPLSIYSTATGGEVVVGVVSRNFNAPPFYPCMWRSSRNHQPELLAHLGNGGFVYHCRDGVAYGYIVTSSNARRAARWNLSTQQVEDLNITYANLLSNGSVLMEARRCSPNGRYIVGVGYNAATRREEAFLLDTQRCASDNGDVDDNGCVNDADLLQVLFAFGSTGSNLGRVDTNCDGVVDDADLMIVLFNFGSGC